MIYDLIRLVSLYQMARNRNIYLISFATLAMMALAIFLWSSSNIFAQFFSFVYLFALTAGALFVFLQSPSGWLSLLANKIIYFSLLLVKLILYSAKLIILGILYLIYVISPIDLIPGDAFTIIGLIDDALLGLFYIIFAQSQLARTPEIKLTLQSREQYYRMIAALGISGLFLGFLKFAT